MSNPELDPEQIESIRMLLEQQQQALERQLQIGNDAIRPVELDQQSVGRVSRIDAIQQQQMALAGQGQAEQMLEQVKQALGRIESGAFGFCQACEEPIAFARLQVQPFARLCIDCQSAAESS